MSRATYYRHAGEEREWRRKQAVLCTYKKFFMYQIGIPNSTHGISYWSVWYSLTPFWSSLTNSIPLVRFGVPKGRERSKNQRAFEISQMFADFFHF